MSPDEFDSLQWNQSKTPYVFAEELRSPDRTLLYGRTADQYNFHVYLKKGEIHLLIFSAKGKLFRYEAGGALPVPNLVPDGIAFPEQTDILFSHILLRNGIQIPFIGFNTANWKDSQNKSFLSLTKEEISAP